MVGESDPASTARSNPVTYLLIAAATLMRSNCGGLAIWGTPRRCGDV